MAEPPAHVRIIGVAIAPRVPAASWPAGAVSPPVPRARRTPRLHGHEKRPRSAATDPDPVRSRPARTSKPAPRTPPSPRWSVASPRPTWRLPGPPHARSPVAWTRGKLRPRTVRARENIRASRGPRRARPTHAGVKRCETPNCTVGTGTQNPARGSLAETDGQVLRLEYNCSVRRAVIACFHILDIVLMRLGSRNRRGKLMQTAGPLGVRRPNAAAGRALTPADSVAGSTAPRVGSRPHAARAN